MAAMPKIKFNMTIPYRGTSKTWSTSMHFNGGFPASLSAATTLISNMVTDFKAGVRADVEFVNALLYPNDTDPFEYNVAIETFGSLPTSDGTDQAAIICALLSWTTDARNSRGGPVYLRNFIHGAETQSGDLDAIVSAQKSALQTFAAKFDDAGVGYSDGTNTYKRAGPNGVAGLVGTCETFASRRVLARRG